MKKFLQSLLLTATALLAFSCQQELIAPEAGSSEPYFASIDEGDATKVGIDGSCELFWHAGDEISIFLGPRGQKYTFAGADGDKSGKFVADKAAEGSFDRAYALYPYTADAECSASGEINVSVPSVQHYVADGFDPNANVMLAATTGVDDYNLHFKNVGGYLKLKIYGTGAIKSITLAGLANETITAGFKTITLDCGEGVNLTDSADDATAFWLVVPPVKFPEGFQITITDTDGMSVIKQTFASFEISRNTICSISPFRVATGGGEFVKFGVKDSKGHLFYAHDVLGPYITVTVPKGTDRTALKPVFEINGTKVVQSGKTLTSGTNVLNFSIASLQDMSVVYGQNQKNTYHIRVIETDLPTLFVSTPGHADVVDKEDWHSSSRIFLADPDGSITDLGLTGIRGRGNFSWEKPPKKGYNLKLEEKQSVLGFKKHKRWRLMAGWFGITNNDFYLEAGRRTSIGWSPRGDYVELVLNGQWFGIYWLCEHMSIDKNRLNITEMKATDLTEPAITGGYLLEFDTSYDTDPKFTTAHYGYPVMVSSHDEDSPAAQIRWIEDYINNFEASLMDESRRAAGEFFDYIDVDSFCDWFFITEIAEKFDFRYPRSVFMHKDRGGKLAMGPIWDFDYKFLQKNVTGGLSCRADLNGASNEADDNGWFMTHALYYDDLLKSEEFKARLKARWPIFKASIESMPAYHETVASKIQYSAARDYNTWRSVKLEPSGANRPFKTFAEEKANVVDTFLYNVEWIDAHLDEL